MKWHKPIKEEKRYGIARTVSLRALYGFIREHKPASLSPTDIQALMNALNRPKEWTTVNKLLELCGYARAGDARVIKHVYCGKPNYRGAEALLREHEGLEMKKRRGPEADDVKSWRRRCAAAVKNEAPGYVPRVTPATVIRRLAYYEPALWQAY